MMQQRAVHLNLPKSQSLDIVFQNIVYDVQLGFLGPKKTILNGVSGRFNSGELTVIMGPSGAGKSTLLNLLTGYNPDKIQGKIEYIGSVDKQSWTSYRKESCYIQQEDRLHSFFTVSEAMRTAADLKLGNSLNKKAKMLLIEDILDTLDLTKAKDTRCSKLSGGQKKRLSIALELVDNPPVMFLDEPTTGLDSSSSLQCIVMLRSLAKSGRTIVCTIHQPTAALYEIFDHVYLMADGRCVYQGSPANTVAYFQTIGLQCPQYHNPADFMIEVVSKEYGDFNDQLAKASGESSWRLASVGKAEILSENNMRRYSDEGKAAILINPPSEFSRLLILMNRSAIETYRDWTALHLKVVLHFFVGVILGLLYVDAGIDGSKAISNVGYFLVTVVYLCYTSMLPAVLRVPSDMAVVKKERFNNWYQLKTYYFAMILTNLPLQVLYAVIYSSVSYFLSSQVAEINRFAMFLGISILTNIISESIGIFIGTLANPMNGIFFGAITTCTLLIFAGVFALFKDIPRVLYYVSYASCLRYAVDGLVQSIYGFNRENLICPAQHDYCHFRVPEVLMTEFSFNGGKYWVDVVVLVVNILVIRVVTYYMLRRKLTYV